MPPHTVASMRRTSTVELEERGEVVETGAVLAEGERDVDRPPERPDERRQSSGERVLDPGQVERFPAACASNRRVEVAPRPVHVDHQVDVVAARVTRCCEAGGVDRAIRWRRA